LQKLKTKEESENKANKKEKQFWINELDLLEFYLSVAFSLLPILNKPTEISFLKPYPDSSK